MPTTTIHEYPIPLPSGPAPQPIRLPDGARLLSVRVSRGEGMALPMLLLAARIDPEAAREGRMSDRTIRVVRAGERIGNAARSVGEVELEGGERAWVFEGP